MLSYNSILSKLYQLNLSKRVNMNLNTMTVLYDILDRPLDNIRVVRFRVSVYYQYLTTV